MAREATNVLGAAISRALRPMSAIAYYAGAAAGGKTTAVRTLRTLVRPAVLPRTGGQGGQG